jgi:hypothetical protein
MDQFLSEQEVRERQLRRSKARVAALKIAGASGRPLRVLRSRERHAITSSASRIVKSTKASTVFNSTGPAAERRASFRTLGSVDGVGSPFIVHRVEV